jgi:hypothetical protein
MGRHKSLTGVNLHKAFNWVQDADPLTTNPADVIDGHYWHETDTGIVWYLVSGSWVNVGGASSFTHTAITDFDEAAQDAVGTIVSGTSPVTVVYTDGAPSIVVALDAAAIAELIRDTVAAALVAGSDISIAVDDPGNTITINSTGSGYTDEQARDAIAAALVAGTGVTVTVDDPGDHITIDATGSYTNEMAMDAIAAMFAAGSHTGISFSYNDAGDAISATVSITQYTDEMAMDAIAAMIAAGSHTGISFAYDDAGNAISATVTGGAAPGAHAATHVSGSTDPLTGALDSNARVAVRKNDTGATVATRRRLDLIEGSGITLTIADDSGAEETDVTIASSITQYTDEMARDALGTALVAGTGVTVTVDDPGDHITIATTITQYTDEMAQDAINALLAFSGYITGSYNDAGNAFTLTVAKHLFGLDWNLDEGGVPATGTKAMFRIPFACVVKDWALYSDVTGSITIDVQSATHSAYPTFTSIIGIGTKPALASAQKAAMANLTNWTTAIAADTIVTISVSGPSDLSFVMFHLQLERS